MAEVIVGDVPNADNLPEVDLPEFSVPQADPLEITITPDPDIQAHYLEQRRLANAKSSLAFKEAQKAGHDPALVTTGIPMFDDIETRFDGMNLVRVGVDRDNPEKSVVLNVVSDITKGVASGALEGLQEAGQEIGDTLTNGLWSEKIAPWLRETLPGLQVANEAVEEAMRPEGVVQEVSAAIASPLAQVVAPGAMMSRAFRAAGVGNRLLSEFLGYSAAEIAAIDPRDQTLMEVGLQLIDDDPEIQNIVEQAFEAQEADSDFMRRLKNAPRKVVEGGAVGLVAERVFDAIGLAYRAIRNSRYYQNAAQNMKDRAAEGKSPIPMGMSIEDAGQEATGFRMEIDSANIDKAASRAKLTAADKAKISELANASGVDPAIIEQEFRRLKAQYPESDGWAPFNVVDLIKEKDGSIALKLQEQAYGFNRPKGADKAPNEADPKLVKKMAKKLADEVVAVKARADGGDANAKIIMGAQSWYRVMRDRLRREFGSFGDVFADVIGTTSAQTNVRQNWENAVEVLRQFSRGEYDAQLAIFKKWMDGGGTIGSGKPDGNGYVDHHYRIREEATASAEAQAAAEGLKGKAADARVKEIVFEAAQEQFPLITKADGKTLFNANSPATMAALLDLFRIKQAGDSPKTPNFTGNLIGYSSLATIDVWAARLLRRISGQKRVVPGAEQGVSGSVNADGKTVGGEFGFGQEVFSEAANILRAQGIDLGDDDLQAVAWFLEKEIWAENGWTTRSGEGGSLEAEANRAGVNDQAAVKDALRKVETDPTASQRRDLKAQIEDADAVAAIEDMRVRREEIGFVKDLSPAKARDRLMADTGIDKDAAVAQVKELRKEVSTIDREIKKRENLAPRLAALEEKLATQRAEGREFLEQNQAIVRRFTGGLSLDQGAKSATDTEMNAAQVRILDDAAGDDSIVMIKATSSKGRYIDPDGGVWDERTIDFEYISRQQHDTVPMIRRLVQEAKDANQESAFFSEVVDPGSADANPGLEVYFGRDLNEAEADAVTEIVNSLDLDVGFTFATDLRYKERSAAGAASGDYVGIRMQYIPEFGGGDAGADAVIDKLHDVIEALGDQEYVSNVQEVGYNTQVFFRDNGDYDAYLRAKPGTSN